MRARARVLHRAFAAGALPSSCCADAHPWTSSQAPQDLFDGAVPMQPLLQVTPACLHELRRYVQPETAQLLDQDESPHREVTALRQSRPIHSVGGAGGDSNRSILYSEDRR